MHDKLVDAGKPGDRVEVTGIYRAMSVRIGPTQRTVKSLFKTYIDCLHLKKTDKLRMNAEDPMEVENGSSRNDEDTPLNYEDKVEQLKELSRQPDIYERLTKSLAPNIWELDDIKKGLLCQGLMVNHKEIVEYFNSRGVSAIFLFRRNTLRQMVSVLANSYDQYAKLLNGTHKSHVHSPVEADTLSRYKPTINSTSLMMDLKQMESTSIKAMEYFSSTRHIVLYFEDLIKNHTVLAATQTPGENCKMWFQGTADVVCQFHWLFED